MLYIETDVKFVQRENDLKVDFFYPKATEWLILQTKNISKLFHSETQNDFIPQSTIYNCNVTSHPLKYHSFCILITCLYPPYCSISE